MPFARPDNNNVLSRPALWVLISWAIIAFSASGAQAGGPADQELLRLLPLPSDLRGWTLDGDPQTAEGMALFELINGGAEEYVKEGFRRAVTATYKNKEGKRINLDIYEMLSPGSAKRIHLKKAGDKGKKVPVGEEAALEDYYLNFRTGAYQVTLSGYDTQKETLEGILLVGRLVAERIGRSAGSP
jgi:hypothetical protein